jgi:multiple sugar transport system permease protein
VTPYIFLVIPVALLAVLTYIPILQMFYLSLVSWDGFAPTKSFVGLDNYVQVFTNPDLYGVFFVSLYYLVGSFVQIALALYLATIISSGTRFRNFFKGVIFFPYLLNGVAISFIFLYFFRPAGVLDSFSGIFGADPNNNPLWIGDRSLVNISLTFVSVWRYMGLNFVLFLGAIQSISPEVLEAAEVDGANRWQQLRFVIIPGIKPIISLSLILGIAGALSAFEIPFIMTQGQSGSATFVVKTVQMAFSYSQYGVAAAMAVVLLVIILIVTGVQRLLIRDEPPDLTQ